MKTLVLTNWAVKRQKLILEILLIEKVANYYNDEIEHSQFGLTEIGRADQVKAAFSASSTNVANSGSS